jgi:pimeloyl-ACP methyl ester carboxylesterase
VVALDSRGHGRSTDDTGALSYARMADDAVAALDALGLERVDVVGWSDGGIVGLDLALRHPERVGKLVAIGSNYRTDGYSEAGRATIASARADAPELAGARLFYRRVAPEPARWPTLVRKVADMWHREPSYADADLARIGAPTLLVLGEHDDVRLDHAEAMARLMPRARVRVIAGTTHLVPLEQPQQLAAEISRFLDAP